MSSGGKWTKIDVTGAVLLRNGIVSGPGVVDLVYATDTTLAAGAVRVKSNRLVGEPMAGTTGTTSTGLWSADSNVLYTIRTGGTGDPNIYTWTDTMNVAGTGVVVTVTGTTTATVTWTAQADAGAYRIIVNPVAQTNFYTAANGIAPPSNVLVSTPTTAAPTTSLITVMTAGTEYYVSVWARDGSANAISGFLFSGAATSFTTNLGPVVGTIGLAPAPAAANVPVMPTFQWSPPGTGATPTGYLLEVSTVSDFATTILAVALPSAETYYAWQGSALDYGTVYYWRVTASGVSSSVPVSSVFTTEAEPVDPVDVITPTTPDIILQVPAAEQITPAYIWAIIAVGFVLTVAVIILIVRTRRVV